MSFSERLQQGGDICLCNMMKNRIDELKHRKTKKIQLYDKITHKFGKTSEVQKCMFAIFRDNLDEKFNLNTIETIVKNRLVKSKENPKNSPSEKPVLRKTLQSIHRHKTLDSIPEKEDNLWATIIKHETERFCQEAKDKTLREFEIKTKIKKELDKQVKDKQNKFIEELNNNRSYDSKVSEFTKIQEIKGINFSTMLKNRFLKEKQMQDEFLKETQKRQQEKLINDKNYEDSLVKKIKQDIASEIHGNSIKKMSERKIYLQIINENEEIRKKEIEMRKKEMEEDAICMKEYALMLEKQEQDRVNNARRIEDRFQKGTNVHAHSAVQHENGRRVQEDMDLYKSMRVKETNDKIREEQEWKKKQEIQRQLKEEYENQINIRNNKLANEKKNEIKIVNEFKKDYEDYKLQLEKRTRDEKNLNLMHAKYLKAQMHHKTHSLS